MDWNAYQNKYTKENLKQVALRFNRLTETDLIEKIESVKNKSGYIKNLMYLDMEIEKLTKNAGIANMNVFVKNAVLEKLQKEGR